MIALVIYVIVLFPKLVDFIYMIAISIFLTKNPVHILLVDVYYYISLRHEKKGGMLLCCAPLMYRWFLSHLPKKGLFIEQNNASFPQRMGSLRANDISWYFRYYDGIVIIFNYGDFPDIL